MADCYAPEADDLHRRWLPREIFADIGIVDGDGDAEVPPKAAAATSGIIGRGKGKVSPRAPPPPAVAAPCHSAPVCGLEGRAVASYGGSNGGGVGAPAAWPFPPHSPVQRQAASNLTSPGGALDYSRLPPPACCVPPAANMRSGTGVFLPRVQGYRHPGNPPAKDGKSPRAWPGRPGLQQREEAAGSMQQWQKPPMQPQQATSPAMHAGPAVALPRYWSYH